MTQTRFKKTPLHYLQFIGLKSACLFFRLLPYKMAVACARSIVGACRFVMPKRFKRMEYDISRAFPDKTPKEVFEIARESWKNMGVILAEFVKLSAMKPQEFSKHCRIIGAEKLRKAENVTGGIIHIGHFTDWEAFGLAASVAGFDKAVLAQRIDNPYIDEEVNRLRNIFSGRTFYSNHEDLPFFACIRWLKKKKFIGILIDQNAGSSEVWLPFMGRTAAYSPITALLSIKMQVPVFPVNVERDNDGMITCHVYDPVFPPQEYTTENVRTFTYQLSQIYEQFLRKNPAAWLWAHNRWKREAEGNDYLEKHPEERV